jgi:hypothetical protein
MSEFVFSEEVVLEKARESTGLTDFGGDDFRAGLRALLETYESATAGLNEKGRKLNWRRVVQLLETRLRVQAALTLHPEILEEEIRRPMYLIGLPRTGTSALFNLLGRDPATRPLLLWEGIYPDPLEDLEEGQPDPRYMAIKESFDRMREKNPDFTKIHFAGADVPEECVIPLAYTFCHAHIGLEVLIEPYQTWFQRQDLHGPYAYYRDLLKMLQWQRPGERWLLKSPAHLWAMDVLVDLFPDTCIIVTHRDPLESIPSYCSMMESLFQGRGFAEQKDLGPTVLEYLARSVDRALEARDHSDPNCFADVRFEDFVSDPLTTARGIYNQFDIELTTEAETALVDQVENNPKGKHGAHRYTLEQYGLTADKVKDRLGKYIDRFELESS